jgi:GTP-binding protein
VVIALNKCDLLTQEEIIEKTTALGNASGMKIYPIAARINKGVRPILELLLDYVLRKDEK